MDENRHKVNRSSFERWGVESTGFFLVGLAGAVFLCGELLTNLWPGTGRLDFPGFPLLVLVGVVWTTGAMFLAWLLRRQGMDENPYRAPQENPVDFKPTTRPIAKWAWVLLVLLWCLLVASVVWLLQPAIH